MTLPSLHHMAVPVAVGNADGWGSDDSGATFGLIALALILWWVVNRFPLQGRRRYQVIALGRPLQPVALAATLVTGGLSFGVAVGATSRGALLGGPPGVALAVVGAIACVMLTAGWVRTSKQLMMQGLFLAALTWGGTAGSALLDGRPFNAWVSACWAGLFSVSLVIEWTATRYAHGGPPTGEP